jgi:hypothetical protein
MLIRGDAVSLVGQAFEVLYAATDPQADNLGRLTVLVRP